MTLPLIAIILVILTFLVCLGFTSKVWRWFDLVMALFVFGFACWYLCLVSITIKTKSSWQAQHYRLATRLQELEDQYQQVVKGAPLKTKEKPDNLQDLDSMLGRLLWDRGRVWRETKPQGVQNGNNAMLVDTGLQPPPPPNKPLKIFPRVLYIFKETKITVEIEGEAVGKEISVPVKYLGEFHVSQVNGGVISLLPLNRSQPPSSKAEADSWLPPPITPPDLAMSHINDGSTWAIYEKMPVDGHRLFSMTDIFDSDVKLEEEDKLFGDMDETKIRGAFELAAGHNPDLQLAKPLEDYIDNYMEDGRIIPPNEEVDFEVQWVKVKFLKSYEVTVDSGGVPKTGLTESFFDQSGYAIIPNLRKGEKVKFDRGRIGVFHLKSETLEVPSTVRSAQTLMSDANGGPFVEKLTSHYVRPLTDYTFIYQDIYDRNVHMDHRRTLLRREQERLTEALKLANEQIDFRNGEKTKLTAEKTFQQKDHDTAQRYEDQLNSERESLRVDLARLFDENRKLTHQLARIQAKLEAEINKRVDAVGRDSD
jgi:hypothetical protein